MPKAVHDLAEKLLADSSFYPDKDPEERKRIAWATATKQLEGAIEFLQINAPTEITILASDDQGDLLAFKNAILVRAEVNKNNDEVPEGELANLAATIPGRPIDVEHDPARNCGVFTAGRVVSDTLGPALAVDGLVWADRYRAEADGMKAGSHQLSVEAEAATVTCSVCEQSFLDARDYCDHLRARKKFNARRRAQGLKAKGGALTVKPAGTATRFDPAALYFLASHEVEAAWYDSHLKEGETIDDLPASDFADPAGRRFPYKIHGKVIPEGWKAAWSAAHGGHTGHADSSAIAKLRRDKPSGIDIQEAVMDKCPHCGKDSSNSEKCSHCGRSMMAAAIAAELGEALSKLTAAETALSAEQAAKSSLEAEKAKLAEALEAEKSKLTAAQDEATRYKTKVRRTALAAALDDEAWGKQANQVMGMTDDQFELLASMAARPTGAAGSPAGAVTPPGSNGSKKQPITLGRS